MARRTRSGAAPGAPRPKIIPPKTPVLRRRGVRVGVLVIAALGIAWLVLSLMGGAHRRDVLDKYDRALARAMRPFSQHQSASAPDSFLNIPQQFTQGSITPARLRTAATAWQEDFTKAAQQVRELAPPAQLLDAQEVIAQAIDAYGTIAGDYTPLADTKALEQRARGAQKQPLTTLVTGWVAQIEKARTNATALLARGVAMVDTLKLEWGLGAPTPETPLQPTLPIPPGLPIPDGGLSS